MNLSCGKCGADVADPENRACGHNTDPAIAALSATASGEGSARGGKPRNWLEEAIRKTINIIKTAR